MESLRFQLTTFDGMIALFDVGGTTPPFHLNSLPTTASSHGGY